MKTSGALSLLTVVSAASAFHLPVSRIKPRAPLPASLERRGYAILAASGSLTLSNRENNIYTSKMQIKGKDVIMQVDTGSSDTWLYPTRETRDLYTDAVVYTDMPLKLEYGRGAVAGYVGQMTLEFAGYTVQNQSILLVQEQHDMSLIEANLTHGLLGLGFDTLSKIANGVAGATGGQNWGRTILSNIFASDPTTPNHIAFRLDRTGDGNDTDVGAFDVGTFAPGLEAVGNTAEIPIFSSSAEANIYWNVLVDGVTINGKAQTLTSSVTGDRVPPAGKASALLDTGYSLPQLTPELAHAIYSSMGGVLIEDDTNTTYAVPCTAEAQVVFNIGGHAIPIHPLDLTQVQVVSTQSGQNYTWCMNAFQPFSSNAGGGQLDYILGDAFLRNVYSVYDYGDYVRGFSGLATGDPYIKLLPLTDATAASAEFKTARAAELNAAGMPPQLDPTTVNGELKAIPGTGGGSGSGSGGSSRGGSRASENGSGRIGMGIWSWVVAGGLGLAGIAL